MTNDILVLSGLLAVAAGVRALFARAVNWNMLGRPPVKLDWSCAQIFDLDGNGNPTLTESNVSLQPKAASP